MSADRPINADVPAPAPETAPTRPAQPKPARRWRRRSRREPVPLALKLIALAVLGAVGFIVAAVLGGGNGPGGSEAPSPAPAPVTEARPESPAPASEASEQLGYPAFATNNTTRVGGADPASNAAAVALAVFPSTTPPQRPAAVTLVDEDDWAGGIAASVLMAPPVRAPILISSQSALPDASAAALAALAPQGDGTTEGAAAFVLGDVATADGIGKAVRVKTGTAAATAASIASLRDRLLGRAPAHIVIASAEDPAFAMPAAAWAARSGDPVLFAEGDRLPKPTASYLRRHRDARVYVLGPAKVISPALVRAIAKIEPKVRRVAAGDPVSNAIAFARYADGDFGWNVNDPGHGFVLARSDSPLESAAAAALSASGTWGPLLLTDSAANLPSALREYLLDVKPGYTTNPTRAFYNHVWIVGDQTAIDVSQQAEVNQLAELAKIGGQP